MIRMWRPPGGDGGSWWAAAFVSAVALPTLLVAQTVSDRPDQALPALPLPVGVSPGLAAAERAAEGRSLPRRLRDYPLPGLTNTVSLKTLDPWEIGQLIDFLAYRGGLNNVIIGKGVSGLTTKLKFDEIPVADALEIVLTLNNLAYEIRNGVMTIMTDADYQAIHGVSFYENKQVCVLDLKYADPTHVASLLSPLKSPQGTVVADGVTGSLILIDTPERLREMRGIVERADLPTVSRIVPTETRAFALRYAEPEKIEAEVRALLTKEHGSVRSDARTRSLLVTDLPHILQRVQHLVSVFDVPRRQVFIEAKIVTVLLEDQFKMGINWDHLLESANPRLAVASAVNRMAVVEPNSGVGTLTYRTILGGGDLNVVLDLLKTVGETRILSNPHVAVLSDEEAVIKVVRDEPYAEAQLEAGTTNVVGETIKFIEVGVKLTVKPRVSDDGFISMSIQPEISDVVREYQAFRKVPVVQRSFAETAVMVRDGQTLMIGGMIQNKRITGKAQVPILGQIPLLGALFRSTSESVKTEETVVFLTPRVITGDRLVPLTRDLEKTPKPPRTRAPAEKGT